MLIREVSDSTAHRAKLMALSQFLLGRAQDTDSSKTISVDAFLKLAANMGISITRDDLVSASQQMPLSNIIANIEGNNVQFRNAETVPGSTPEMTPDMARLTVDNMAKRAIDIG
jgi:hypothetical protein